MEVNWLPEQVLDYIIVPLHEHLAPILDRLATIERKMQEFDEMQQKMRRFEEMEAKLQHLEAVETRMLQLEASLQRALGTFLPRVEQVLEGMEDCPSISARSSTNRGASNTPVVESVIEAAKVGDIESIQHFISQGAHQNEFDASMENALFHAVRNGHIEAVKVLLEAGIDANAVNIREQTSLMLAVHAGHKDIAEALLEHGANIDSDDDEGATAIWYASSTGQSDIVEMLIKKGASIDFGQSYEDPFTTTLEVAAQNGYAETVKTILTVGSGWFVSDLEDALCITDSPDVVWAIARAIPHEFWGEVGARAVMSATRDGRCNALEAMLQAGAPTTQRNMNGLTPLHCASSHENTAAILSLVVNGADIEASDNKGRTPLHLAAIHGKEKSVRALLAKQANRHAVDKRGRTPFDAATSDTVRDLLDDII
ncbi:Uncharacterized protein GBIM_15512 [Gryllus bimaculatus]|nr:Uncharacterized protein GBIM_15512 [Gryllus bimaculatus]